MEWDGEWIVLVEEVEGMDQRITIAEETVNTFLLLGSNVLEQRSVKSRYFFIRPLFSFVYSLLSRVLEFLLFGYALIVFPS